MGNKYQLSAVKHNFNDIIMSVNVVQLLTHLTHGHDPLTQCQPLFLDNLLIYTVSVIPTCFIS